ncbi:maleylacetoacetate isomerase [uncultured Tateyamaria sp.]|uniref:maleylacetoacetate isomerase n=1 Tax=Tateyamaria sp. 1078 TaxID=3417464 RepID=UPI003448D9FE
MKLYSYWRSTTSYRVRAALHLKGLTFDTVLVDLLGGAQRTPDYAGMNPGMGVPTLVLDNGTTLTQSLAIIDYLDAIASPRLLPDNPLDRARVMAAAHAVALDIHPVNNLRVVQHLQAAHGASADDAKAWMQHWIVNGFTAVEAMVSNDTRFAFGDTPDLADICIVSQAYNAHRWGLDMSPFPRLARIEAACLDHPAIAAAHPDNQPDAQ